MCLFNYSIFTNQLKFKSVNEANLLIELKTKMFIKLVNHK